MAWSGMYEDEKEKDLHARVIRKLSEQCGADENTVKELYERELAELKTRARVKDFLSMLIERRLRQVLLPCRARSHGGESIFRA